jgi:hypothetical protein
VQCTVLSQFPNLRTFPTFEDFIDEGVYDAHGFARNSSVWMDLFQDLEDVDGIRFLPLLSVLLSVLIDVLLSFVGFLYGFSTSF